LDTTRNILYRGFYLNEQAIQANIVPGQTIGTGIHGCVVDSADFSDVDVVQFMEKRSLQDGMDAGVPFLGARRIRVSGTLYALSRALLFDAYWSLRAALSPVLAQRESPGDMGYRPLYFSVPTNRIADYPAGAIDLQVLALPRAFQATFNDDAQGGEDTDSLAIPWQATFVCKDPSIMGDVPQDYTFTTKAVITGATASAATNLVTKTTHGLVTNSRVRFSTLTGGTGLNTTTNYYVLAAGLTANDFKVSLTSGGAEIDITVNYTTVQYVVGSTQAGNTINRGTYICPVNALWQVGPQSGSIQLSVGDSAFTITIPSSAGNRIIRYKGQDKILTVEENAVEVTRLDLLSFAALKTHPVVPTGTVGWSVTFHGTSILTGSHFWFWESYA